LLCVIYIYIYDLHWAALHKLAPPQAVTNTSAARDKVPGAISAELIQQKWKFDQPPILRSNCMIPKACPQLLSLFIFCGCGNPTHYCNWILIAYVDCNSDAVTLLRRISYYSLYYILYQLLSSLYFGSKSSVPADDCGSWVIRCPSSPSLTWKNWNSLVAYYIPPSHVGILQFFIREVWEACSEVGHTFGTGLKLAKPIR